MDMWAESRIVEINAAEQKKKKKEKKNENNLRDLWDNTNDSNIWIIGILKEEMKSKVSEKIF